MTAPRKFVQVGLGGRHAMFRDAVVADFSATSSMAALCDNNPGRLRLALDAVQNKHDLSLRGYAAEDFERMLRTERPDCVIVTTPDYLHDHYVCRAMELGCDVMTEKPMTTDAVKCARIMETQRRTGQRCTVTFNYLFDPAAQPVDRYRRAADQRAGAWSILTGVAGNRSMQEGRAVRIDELLTDIGMPEYP